MNKSKIQSLLTLLLAVFTSSNFPSAEAQDKSDTPSDIANTLPASDSAAEDSSSKTVEPLPKSDSKVKGPVNKKGVLEGHIKEVAEPHEHDKPLKSGVEDEHSPAPPIVPTARIEETKIPAGVAATPVLDQFKEHKPKGAVTEPAEDLLKVPFVPGNPSVDPHSDPHQDDIIPEPKVIAPEPEPEDSELAVEWDRWRNRFMRVVQLNVQEYVNNPDSEDYQPPKVDPKTGKILPRFPLGIIAYFSCQVSKEGEVKNLQIFQSSGFANYDRAVLKAVRKLQGTPYLRFPRGTRRDTVIQESGIRISQSNDFRYHDYGDVEKIRVPGSR